MTTTVASALIQAAYEDSGIVQVGVTISTAQQTKGLSVLQDLVNLWQTQGVKLWLETDLSVPLVAGTATYVLTSGGSEIMRIKQGYYLDTNNVRRPLVVLSRDDYTRLSNVVTQGAINSYYLDKQATVKTVYLWPTPDTTAATGTAHFIVQRQVTQLASVSTDTGFPPEWAIALRWGIADEICTGQPEPVVQRCAQRAAAFRQALEDWDVEDAPTYFQPDSRAFPPRAFR